jgi:hypothetical protein
MVRSFSRTQRSLSFWLQQPRPVGSFCIADCLAVPALCVRTYNRRHCIWDERAVEAIVLTSTAGYRPNSTYAQFVTVNGEMLRNVTADSMWHRFRSTLAELAGRRLTNDKVTMAMTVAVTMRGGATVVASCALVYPIASHHAVILQCVSPLSLAAEFIAVCARCAVRVQLHVIAIGIIFIQVLLFVLPTSIKVLLYAFTASLPVAVSM